MEKIRHTEKAAVFKDPRHEALIRVWWTGQLLRKHANRFFRKHHSNDVQFNVLMQLKAGERPLNQRELSERLFVDKSNLTGVAGRMEAAGLIERDENPDDKRAYWLRLAPGSREALAKMEEPYREEVMEIMRQFSDREVAALTAMMRSLRQAVQRTFAQKGKTDDMDA